MFQPARRTQAKMKLALTGPSGSGKTYSALMVAKGLGEKIAVVDTENGSASLYANVAKFDTAIMDPPYLTEKYIEAIEQATAAGYDTLIIDSATHAWAGQGGLLEQKDAIDSRGGNSFANWSKVSPKHEAFLAAIVNAKINLIVTMRSKQDYVLADNKGKQTPQKVGMAPVQREGTEYEFTTVLDIAMDHKAKASKDRTGLFGDTIFKISEATGDKIKKWLEGAEEAPPVSAPPPVVTPTPVPVAAAPKAIDTANGRGWNNGPYAPKPQPVAPQEELKSPWDMRIPATWKTKTAGQSLRELGIDGTLQVVQWLETKGNLSPVQSELLSMGRLALSLPQDLNLVSP